MNCFGILQQPCDNVFNGSRHHPRFIHGTVGLKSDVAGEGGQDTNDGIHEDPWSIPVVQKQRTLGCEKQAFYGVIWKYSIVYHSIS